MAKEFNYVGLSRSALWHIMPCDAIKSVNMAQVEEISITDKWSSSADYFLSYPSNADPRLTGRGGRIGRAQASHAGDLEFGSRSSQANNLCK